MIKDIVVNLPLRQNNDRSTAFAASLASYFGAHLTGIAFILWPVIPSAEFGPAQAEFIKKQDAAAKQAADAAVERLEFEVRRENISWNSHQIAISVDSAPGRFAEIARAFDIAVVAQAESGGDMFEKLIVEAALFQSGNPILVVPYVQKAAFKIDRVMILWDGSATATRAVVGLCRSCIALDGLILFQLWVNAIFVRSSLAPTWQSICRVMDSRPSPRVCKWLVTLQRRF